MKHALIILALVIAPLAASAAGNVNQVTAANFGFSSAQSINGTPVATGVHMDGNAGFFNRITVLMTIVWGTTALMNVTAEVSFDNTNWFDVVRCSDAVTHDCAPRTWQYDPTDGTTPTLEFGTGSKYIRFTFDDPATGNGTIVASAILGR